MRYPSLDFALGIPPADIPQPSPAGNLYVCVLAQGAGALLDTLTLSYDYLAQPPVDLAAEKRLTPAPVTEGNGEH